MKQLFFRNFNLSNYQMIDSASIEYLSISEVGGMDGSVQIITKQNGEVRGFSSDYFDGITKNKLPTMFPSLHFNTQNDDSDCTENGICLFKHIYLGMGRHLYVKSEHFQQFFSKLKNIGGRGGLYEQWEYLAVNSLA